MTLRRPYHPLPTTHHLPPTTYALTSGVECVSIYLNARLATVHLDRHHVEPARAVVQAVPGQVVYGHLRDASLLPRRERLGASAKLFPDAGLHLDEHRHLVYGRDDVNFSKFCAVATIKNCVPQALELSAREIFPSFPRICRASSDMRFWWHVPRQVRGQGWGQGVGWVRVGVRWGSGLGSEWGLTPAPNRSRILIASTTLRRITMRLPRLGLVAVLAFVVVANGPAWTAQSAASTQRMNLSAHGG